MTNINQMHFPNLQSAWEGINEFLVTEEQKITRDGGGMYSTEMISYNNHVSIDAPYIDPEFDFGKVLGYTPKKWSALVANYVDFHYLEMIRAELSMRHNRGARSYNYAFHFKNKHGSGKDCLISMNFTKRMYSYYPIVVFYVRVSEVTKRLIFDFLLVQRIIEYVYGPNPEVRVEFVASSFYLTPQAFVIYNNHKSIAKLLKPLRKVGLGKFQQKVWDVYQHFKTADPESITYKSHRRSAMQIQRGEDGEALSGRPSVKAKDLKFPQPVSYPKEVITDKQMRDFLRGDTVQKHVDEKAPKAKSNYVPKTQLLRERMAELNIDPSGIKTGRGRLSIKEMEGAIAKAEAKLKTQPKKKVKLKSKKKTLKVKKSRK